MNNYEKLFVNDKEYQIESLLGKGKGGYSYLASKDGHLFVLKQIHHEPCDYYTFGDKIISEVNDYKRLLGADIRIPKLYEVDTKQERLLKEYIDGDTIFHMLKYNADVKPYVEQVLEMCEKVKKKGLNIDYFPTNFVVSNNLLYYIDYECNEYSEKWNFENWGVKYWSRTPEFEKYLKEHT